MISLTQEQLGKLTHLSKDKGTLEALKLFLLNSIIKHKEEEVHTLAASRLAIDILDRTVRELETFSVDEAPKKINQVGL